nr:MAG TPA_asm: hypothetical protein [Caudoviricetes sp.]
MFDHAGGGCVICTISSQSDNNSVQQAQHHALYRQSRAVKGFGSDENGHRDDVSKQLGVDVLERGLFQKLCDDGDHHDCTCISTKGSPSYKFVHFMSSLKEFEFATNTAVVDALNVADRCIRFGIDVDIFVLHTVLCVVVDILQHIVEGFFAVVRPTAQLVRKAQDADAAHICPVAFVRINMLLQLIVQGCHTGDNLILLVLLAVNTMQQPANDGSQCAGTEEGQCNFHGLCLLKILAYKLVREVLQHNGAGLIQTLAEVGFAVLRVEVVLAVLVLHAPRCRDGVINRSGRTNVDDYPQRWDNRRCPVCLRGVRLQALVYLAIVSSAVTHRILGISFPW